MSSCRPSESDTSSNHGSSVSAVALYGHSPTADQLARLFSFVGLQVYLIASEHSEQDVPVTHATLLTDREELPYLSSVVINCQNDFVAIKSLLDSFPCEYQQRMAYVECSSCMREDQLELIYEQMKVTHYLCMNLIELKTSTASQPHVHLICSGDQMVFEKLVLQANLPAKLTFLNQTKSPLDSFYLCLLHRYSQAIHVAIYAEMMALFNAANPMCSGSERSFVTETYRTTTFVRSGHLQCLFDWSYVKRPVMRQLVLQSSGSSMTFTTIQELQFLLECIMDCFHRKNFDEYLNGNHLDGLTGKLYQFISRLDIAQKQRPLFELFTMF